MLKLQLIVLCVCGFGNSILVKDNDHQTLTQLNQEFQVMKSELAALKSVKSDLASLKLENADLKSELSSIKTAMSQQAVAFMAELGKTLTNPSVGHQIVFDIVHLNRGNAYNNIHGMFIAPYNGTYHFSVELSFPSTTPNDWRYTHVHIKKGKQVIGYIYSDGTYPTWIKRTATALVDLVVGEDVYVIVVATGGTETIAGASMHSMFSGFLVTKH